jgi:hypothetical protein
MSERPDVQAIRERAEVVLSSRQIRYSEGVLARDVLALLADRAALEAERDRLCNVIRSFPPEQAEELFREAGLCICGPGEACSAESCHGTPPDRVMVRELEHEAWCGIFAGSVSCNCGAVVNSVRENPGANA